MKKLFMAASLLMLTGGVFANTIAEDTKDCEQKELPVGCCTATLTLNGQYVDHETVCSVFPNYQNCEAARGVLLDRHPDAKKALSAN
jgi:hypothetical protein